MSRHCNLIIGALLIILALLILLPLFITPKCSHAKENCDVWYTRIDNLLKNNAGVSILISISLFSFGLITLYMAVGNLLPYHMRQKFTSNANKIQMQLPHIPFLHNK